MSVPLQYGMEGERSYALYYRHSGRTPLLNLLWATALAFAVAIAAAIVYGNIVTLIDNFVGRIMVPFGFGLAVGASTSWLIKRAKVRSLAVSLAIVAVASSLACYVAALAWINRTSNYVFSGMSLYQFDLNNPVFNPAYAWRVARRISGHPGSLIGYWILEGTLIFAATLRISIPVLRREMFCEHCNRWCGKPKCVRRIEIGDPARLRQSLELHDFSYLESLLSALDNEYWEISHDHCKGCDRLHALVIVQKRLMRYQVDHRRRMETTTLINRLLLNPAEVASLRRGWKIVR